MKTIGWWGMTETITHGTSARPPPRTAPMSMGGRRPSTASRARRRRAPVAPAKPATCWCGGVRGAVAVPGYLDDPEATAAAYTDDGWFITGDRVTLREDGFL